MLAKIIRIGRLYDIYRELLTDKQADFIDLYYNHDLSLGEIAKNYNISRQSVYDTIKKSENLLEDYEKKLKLYDKLLQKERLCAECIENIELIMNSEDTKGEVKQRLKDLSRLIERLREL